MTDIATRAPCHLFQHMKLNFMLFLVEFNTRFTGQIKSDTIFKMAIKRKLYAGNKNTGNTKFEYKRRQRPSAPLKDVHISGVLYLPLSVSLYHL